MGPVAADAVVANALAASPPIGTPEGAELAAEYVVAAAATRARNRRWQGDWTPPLPCTATEPEVRRLSRQRIHRLPRRAVEGLIAWAEGYPVELWTTIPPPRRVLTLQARGARCVSLLPSSASAAPHADGFEFAVHDLCHLAKLASIEHHLEQVGFFYALDAAIDTRAWRTMDAELDDAFRIDLEHVMADMNGSAAFLFSILKMKVKMAARRLIRRRAASPPVAESVGSGPLTPEEVSAYDDLLEHVLDAMALAGELRTAAKQLSTRRDFPAAAELLVDHWQRLGRTRLAEVRESCA